MLEAMQERQVTIGETTYALDDPFWVLATQNPVEQEGVFSLPEAQLDRFCMMVRVNYPSPESEYDMLSASLEKTGLESVTGPQSSSRDPAISRPGVRGRKDSPVYRCHRPEHAQ